MVDWEKLHEKWDEVPEEEKKRIADLFRAKTREKLAELFRKEPWAIFVYEEATGETVTEVRVKVKVDAGETPGEWFGEFYYNEFVPTFWGSPTTEGLKRYLETGEEEVTPKENLKMTDMSPEEIEEELKGLPWPFSHGEPLRLFWKFPDDVEFTEKGKEQWDIYHRTYRREDLELMSVDELKRILRIKGLSTVGKKEELVSRILGVPPPVAPPPAAPPPAIPPPVAPPPKPPVKPPIPLVPEKGLAKADEKRLLTRFEALLLERSIAPPRWRPMFEDALYDWREALKDLPRDEAVSKAFSEVERLVGRVMELAKPPIKPPVAVPVRPPEEVPPVAPPFIIAPAVAPPPAVLREYGMPFSYFLCPACLGEMRETLVMRSPYLETRLMRMGIPTKDSLFFELCEEHKRKYGGAFEHPPRDSIQFWVGEAVAKAEVDIAVLVGMGISEDYVRHCVRFYEENKHLAVQ